MGRFSLAVRDYLDTCDASAGLLSKKYHPTEQGAVKAIFHRGPAEADEIRQAFRDERHRSRPAKEDS